MGERNLDPTGIWVPRANREQERPLSLSSICILRLSALGDVCHVVPLVRAIQDQSPETTITWVVGKLESRLLAGLEGVELLPFDKTGGRSARRSLRASLASRRFDALLLPQRSLRANLLSRLVKADVRVGFDTERSRELHGWFVDRRIAPGDAGQHVMDAVLSFLEPIGLDLPVSPRWGIPVGVEDREFAAEWIPGDAPTLILSPGASVADRCWRPERYAAALTYAVERLGLRAVLCGGPSALERSLGDAILAEVRVPVLDLIGRDTLKRFLALAERADLVLTPDSGPAHMANAVGTPVLGLYAATDCRRSGPYNSRHLSVNRFDEAAEQFLGTRSDALRWGRHIHRPGVMDLVTVDEVTELLDRFVAGSSKT